MFYGNPLALHGNTKLHLAVTQPYFAENINQKRKDTFSKKHSFYHKSVHQKQAISWEPGVFETKTHTNTCSKRWMCCHTTTSERRMCDNNTSREGSDAQSYPLSALTRFTLVVHVKLCSQQLTRSDTF